MTVGGRRRLAARLGRAWAARWERIDALLVSSRLCRLLRIRTHGVALRFTPAAMCRTLRTNPGAYDADLHFYERFLGPGDVVVDAGANIGLVTLVAARLVGPRGVVHAIEPHPRTFADLRANVRLNRAGNVVLHRTALGAAAGTLIIAQFPGDDSQNFVRPEGPGRSVPVARLDDLLPDAGLVTLLKIDVEGYERFALRGAEALLRRTACLYVESWEPLFARYGYGCRDLFADLTAAGFALYRHSGSGAVAPVDAGHVSTRCENLIAVRDVGALVGRTGYRLAAAPQAQPAGRPPSRRT